MLAEAVEEAPGVSEIAVADDTAGRAHLWAYRERHTEAIATLGVAHKLDVTLPLGALAEFAGSVATGRSSPPSGNGPSGTRVILFGHVGDGNVHVNVDRPRALRTTAPTTQCSSMVIERGRLHQRRARSRHREARLTSRPPARPGDIAVMRQGKGRSRPGRDA